MADLSGRVRLPHIGLGATRPPQTLGDAMVWMPCGCPPPPPPALKEVRGVPCLPVWWLGPDLMHHVSYCAPLPMCL